MATLLSRKYSVIEYSYASGSLVFNTPFALGVLSPSHVRAYVRGDLNGLGEQNYLDSTYNPINGYTTVNHPISFAPGIGEVNVVFERTVPKDVLYISFAGGTDVTKTNIDVMVKYTLMALHEVLDMRWSITEEWQKLYDSIQSLLVSTQKYNSTTITMAAGTEGVIGQYTITRGFYTPGDGGGAMYKYRSAVGITPDGKSSFLCANGVVAELMQEGNTFIAEQYGATSGGETSANLQAAWDAMIAKQIASGVNAPMGFAHQSTSTTKNKLKFYNTVDNSRAVGITIYMSSSKLTGVSGGNLSDTNSMLEARLSGGEHFWGELDGGKLYGTWDMNGCGSGRAFGPVARHYKGKGFRFRGAMGSYACFGLIATEYNQNDVEFNTQSNFTATAVSVEDGDFNIYNANILFNNIGVDIDPVAVQVHFVNAHIVGGNPNWGGSILPFTDMVLVRNRATRENHFDNPYFDNGCVKDYSCTLNIVGGHWVDNGASILTQPRYKLISDAPNKTLFPAINIRGLGGLSSVGFVDDGANTWAGVKTGMASFYSAMSSENSAVNVLKTIYNIYPANADIVEVNLKLQGKFEYVFDSGGVQNRMRFDPAGNEVMFTAGNLRVVNTAGDRNVFVGSGGTGISETNGIGGVLNLLSGGAKRWSSDNSGDFYPAADGTQSLGKTGTRLLKAFFRSIGVGTAGVIITSYSGSPEGFVTADRGSLCFNELGGAGVTAYLKVTGLNTNTGWKAIVTL